MNHELSIIHHSFAVTNSSGVVVKLSVKFDVSKASTDTVKGWIAADRTIAFQRTLKSLTEAEIKAFDGKTVVYDGSRQSRQIDPESAMVNLLKGLTPEEQQAKIAELIAKAQA